MSWARRAERLAAAAHAKAIRIERHVENRTIFLFDDLLTTGRQMPAVARLLRGRARLRQGVSSLLAPFGEGRTARGTVRLVTIDLGP
ncbi:hypothetical protein [Streptomyces gardneri]|uniref:Phosphoribosyltransferase domain-containing protein n=1 Tax=Streptomyces gardneri TaxID=66892 RepID=A0A4Y3RNE1_9ACTN|nr:hypothetical protein [Streptomyces gardneri]GEB59112.1 hypothetical protein SGA01_47170 [Streptomyces gardneri]GHH12318.1 hypothetical protein GCM10017674_58300 [Streptomyces gardneri]